MAEVAIDMSPRLKIYKDGRVERLRGCDVVPPGHDPSTNVISKDVAVISENDDVSARIFIPKLTDPNQKLPLLVYFHGGAFCTFTPFSLPYHTFLNSIVSKANVIGLSVHYRRAPEHPLPIAHEDSWASLKWAAAHLNGNGPDQWLNRHADFGNVFFAGDSAGANIAHHMGIRVGTHVLPGITVKGVVLVHPYFWGVERIGAEAQNPEHVGVGEDLWRFLCPSSPGCDDPLINPGKDPHLVKLACERVLVCVAENDVLKDRGLYYKELLEKCGWHGVVEIMEAKGEGHVFHLLKDPNSDNAVSLLHRIASFINHN